MNKYMVNYYDDKCNKKTQVRWGEDAVDAIERMCDQYGWFFRSLKMFDADTRGEEWAICIVERYLWTEDPIDANLIERGPKETIEEEDDVCELDIAKFADYLDWKNEGGI